MGKSIIIVGAGANLSRAVAEKFGSNGYIVGLISRNGKKLEKMITELNAKSIQGFYCQADVYDTQELDRALKKLSLKLGGVNVLFYNVAPMRKKDIMDESVSDLMDDFRLTVGHGLYSVQSLLEDLKTSEGNVIFTGSGFASYPQAEFGSLSLAKAGIKNLTKQLYKVLKKYNIYAGTLTVRGYIQADSLTHSPEILAEKVWEMTQQRAQVEVQV